MSFIQQGLIEITRSRFRGLAIFLIMTLLAGPGTGYHRLVAQDNSEPPSDLPAVIRPGKPVPESEKPAEANRTAATHSGISEEGGEEADAAMKNAMTPEMSKLFPIGRPFSGVRIPSYAGDALSSVVTAEVMRRVDEEHFDMENLVITAYGKKEEPDTRITMARAIYDMTSGKLSSRTPARVFQPRFDMRGDRMIFDSNTQIGHMTGNVRVLIEMDESLSGSMLGGVKPDSESK